MSCPWLSSLSPHGAPGLLELIGTLCREAHMRPTPGTPFLSNAFGSSPGNRAGNTALSFSFWDGTLPSVARPPPAGHSKPVFPFGLSHLSVFYLYKPQTTEACLVNTRLFAPQMLGLEPQPPSPHPFPGKAWAKPLGNRKGLSHREGSSQF